MSPANHYQFSAFATALLNLILFLLVVKKGARTELTYRFKIYCGAIITWSLFVGFATTSHDSQLALLYSQVCHVGGTLIPVCFYHFVCAYLRLDKKPSSLKVAYVTALIFSVLILFYPQYFFSGVSPKLGFPYFPNNGFFYIPWTIYFFSVVLVGFIQLYRKSLTVDEHRKKQIRLFLLANIIGYSGGIGCFLPVYGIDVFPFPYGPYGVVLFSLVTAFTILKYGFLDIEVIIKRTLVFAGLLAMVMAVVAVVSAVVNGVIARSFAIPPNMVAVVSSLLVVVVFDPTRQFLVRVTDRYLFQKKSEIKDILNRLSESVVTIFDLGQIGHTILSTLGETLRLESGVIILRNKKSGNYRLLEHFGIPDDNLNGSIRELISDATIGDYFAANSRTILSLDHENKQIAIPAVVSQWLQITKARVCVPLFISKEQFGLMVLGKKKSDQEFSQEEIDFFPAIATQTSLALRNALLIETVVEEREEKVKAQHEAKRVHYAELLAHEVKNAVTAADLQARSLYEQVVPKFKLIQRKFFSEGLPPVAIKEYEKMCQKITDIGYGIQDRCKKIRVITKTAQHHLSSDLSIFEEIYIRMLWEDAITESGVKNVTFDFHGPLDKDFYAFGNPVLLQRVFINLIKNADDAMTGQAEKRVSLLCDFREVDSKQVAYFRFQDSGPGIRKESAEKIFQRGFSTKPKPKNGDIMASGLGYGLYSCKENIEAFHHGKMWAETPEGGGACFVFWIPIEHKVGV